MDALKSRVKFIREETEQLTRYVTGLPQDVLNLPSACTAWEVGDVIAHWIWFMEYYADFIVSRALQGDLSPLPDQPEGSTVAALDAFHESRAITRRAELGDQLRETLVSGEEPLLRDEKRPFLASGVWMCCACVVPGGHAMFNLEASASAIWRLASSFRLM